VNSLWNSTFLNTGKTDKYATDENYSYNNDFMTILCSEEVCRSEKVLDYLTINTRIFLFSTCNVA